MLWSSRRTDGRADGSGGRNGREELFVTRASSSSSPPLFRASEWRHNLAAEMAATVVSAEYVGEEGWREGGVSKLGRGEERIGEERTDRARATGGLSGGGTQHTTTRHVIKPEH